MSNSKVKLSEAEVDIAIRSKHPGMSNDDALKLYAANKMKMERMKRDGLLQDG